MHARIERHRLVRLEATNPCRDRVVWIFWFRNDEASESDFDVLVLYPETHLDWSASDLDRLSLTIGLPVGAELLRHRRRRLPGDDRRREPGPRLPRLVAGRNRQPLGISRTV